MEINWNAVLPGEIDWDAVLPDHQWKSYGMTSWDHVIPPPRKQLMEILPENIGGSCAVHSFSESLTGMLRIGLSTNEIAVDLPRLLHLSAAKGYLTPDGSNLVRLGELANKYGIPLEGKLPDKLQFYRCYDLDDPSGDVYAIDTTVYSFDATPMPFKASRRTAEVAKQVIIYRERLCDLLDFGPMVICYDVDKRYGDERQHGEPYCRVKGSWLFPFATPTLGHCVTAYGYQCPGGDVRTLRVMYQENMIGAPTDKPGRHLIHPDAIRSYHVPAIKNLKLTNTPCQGYKDVEMLHPPKKQSLWDKIINNMF